MNNQERSQWIDNDEDLYMFWKASFMSKTKFMREYRDRIDVIIKAKLSKKPNR